MDKIGDIYEAFLVSDYPFPEKEYFYNHVFKNYYEAAEYAISNFTLDIDPATIRRVKNILREYHKRLGLLTPKVEENIENIENGVVLAGHQSIIFGGAGLIANKITTVVNIANISSKIGHKLTPTFFINTHDGFHSEIGTIHLPVKQSGTSKSISLKDYPYGIVLDKIKTNNYHWLEKNLSLIGNIFSEFSSLISTEKRKLFNERVQHIITFLRETYRTSANLGEWNALIWGIQANILNDWGVVFIPSSNKELKQLKAKAYKVFLEKREQYIKEFNRATKKIKKMDLKPTTPVKKEDYVPFFYECPNDGYRVVLSYSERNGKIFLEGKCPLDKESYQITLNKNDIDLSDYAESLSPRLDTNQATIQSFLPVVIRVSGPGEINYNAQVIPANRAIGIKLPIYVKYTRMLYNTPWIEQLSKTEELKNYSIFSSDFFRALGKLAKAKRKEDKGVIKESYKAITRAIKKAIKELRITNSASNTSISKYRSWQFGMFDKHHNWQEVSWPWFIMASITGLNDYLSTYRRYYTLHSLTGHIGYLNTQL